MVKIKQLAADLGDVSTIPHTLLTHVHDSRLRSGPVGVIGKL